MVMAFTALAYGADAYDRESQWNESFTPFVLLNVESSQQQNRLVPEQSFIARVRSVELNSITESVSLICAPSST